MATFQPGEIVNITAPAGHNCQPTDLSEIRMSGCAFGCKVMACAICRKERVVPSIAYGCQQDVAHGVRYLRECLQEK